MDKKNRKKYENEYKNDKLKAKQIKQIQNEEGKLIYYSKTYSKFKFFLAIIIILILLLLIIIDPIVFCYTLTDATIVFLAQIVVVFSILELSLIISTNTSRKSKKSRKKLKKKVIQYAKENNLNFTLGDEDTRIWIDKDKKILCVYELGRFIPIPFQMITNINIDSQNFESTSYKGFKVSSTLYKVSIQNTFLDYTINKGYCGNKKETYIIIKEIEDIINYINDNKVHN